MIIEKIEFDLKTFYYTIERIIENGYTYTNNTCF